jgi:hypothetical protein
MQSESLNHLPSHVLTIRVSTSNTLVNQMTFREAQAFIG